MPGSARRQQQNYRHTAGYTDRLLGKLAGSRGPPRKTPGKSQGHQENHHANCRENRHANRWAAWHSASQLEKPICPVVARRFFKKTRGPAGISGKCTHFSKTPGRSCSSLLEILHWECHLECYSQNRNKWGGAVYVFAIFGSYFQTLSGFLAMKKCF